MNIKGACKYIPHVRPQRPAVCDEKSIIQRAIEEQTRKTDEILRNAFQKHFGFPFEEATIENFEAVSVQGKVWKEFRYCGEPFLRVWKEEYEVDPYLTKPEWPQFKVTTKFEEL